MRYAVLLLILLCSAASSGAELEPVLVAPSDAPVAGHKMVFSVYLHNPGDEVVSVGLSETVVCRLRSGDQTIEVAARSIEPMPGDPVEIRGKGFIKLHYAFIMPESIKGTVTLQAPAFNHAGVMFAVVGGPPPSQAAEVEKTDEIESQKYPSLDSLFALYQPYLGNIAAYEPMYFLVGTDPEKSKFQVSLKYRFFNPEGSLARRFPWIQGFHFAYTQTSFWDLKSASMPFEDTSYKPELLFLSSNIDTGAPGIKRLFLQTGFQHESNGRGEEFSRSTNIVYAKPVFIFFNEKNRFGLQVSPKVWAYVNNDDDTNPDLEDYRGYFDLELKFGKADSFVLGSHFGWAKEGGSVQVDLTYPLHRFLFKNFDWYLQAQYVNSLAESLLNYRERTEAFRLGFAIVR